MSKAVIERLKAQFGARILATSDFRGDEEAMVAPSDWLEVARFLLNDSALQMNQFVDLTAVDYIERDPKERFEVLLSLRSLEKKHRVRIAVKLADGQALASVADLWAGANWAEREVWDMFGISFSGHPDLRRILMYDEFEGYPLRKDYPIERTQPLVPYRDVDALEKLPPFGLEEGQPFGRVNWSDKVAGRDEQVSPAIALQEGQRRALSDSEANMPEDGA